MLNNKIIATIEEEEEGNNDVKLEVVPPRRESMLKGNNNITISRTETMSKIPEINSCSDILTKSNP